jgi:hemoglobin
MPEMIAFWSAALRGSSNRRSNPMVVHRALPDLTHSMFERWLDLFHEAASVLPNRAMGQRAVELSQRIAQSLWCGYQLHREPDQMPVSLPNSMTAAACHQAFT